MAILPTLSYISTTSSTSLQEEHVWVNVFPSQGLSICNSVSSRLGKQFSRPRRSREATSGCRWSVKKSVFPPTEAAVRNITVVILGVFFRLFFMRRSLLTEIPSRLGISCVLHIKGVQGPSCPIILPMRSICLSTVAPAGCTCTLWTLRL